MRYATIPLLFSALCSTTLASDWLTWPAAYSHDPATGQRIAQYQAIELPTTDVVPNFQSSGYTHTRSRLGFRGSNDNYHRVETWGDPVRPYGEWQRPFRPYSVPYSLWGAPFAGLNYGFGPYGRGGPGFHRQGDRGPSGHDRGGFDHGDDQNHGGHGDHRGGYPGRPQ